MSIPSQLPQLVSAARTGALQALALQAGQMLDGKVIGPAPNGGTQVQIAGQMLNLVLPLLTKAGETLKFEVQGSGAQVRLALQPAPTPGMPTAAPMPVPLPAQPNSLPLPSAQAVAANLPAGRPEVQTAAQSIAPAAPQRTAAPPATAQQSGAPLPSPQQVTTSVSAAPASPSPASSSPPVVQAQPTASQPTPTQPAVPVSATPGVATAPAVPGAPAAPIPVAVQQPLPIAQPYAAAAKVAATPAPPQPTAVPAAVRAASVPAPTVQSPPAVVVPAQPLATVPATPQAALAQMVQAALPRQDGITSLTAALVSIAGKVALPEPVIRAAHQVLAGRVTIDGKLDAAVLQKAILSSGVFQEAALARPGLAVPTPQADMKSALLALRQTLTVWLGQQAPLTPAAQIPPPLRGHVPRARTSDAAPLDPRAAPDEVGKQLLERTEAALSRVRLHQHASLPDPVAKSADWSMDLPVLIGTQQTLLHLQIHRDQENASEAASERGWQLRFALNLPGMGEVGAQVSIRGRATGVMLWATERATSDALEDDIAALRETLATVGLQPGAIIVRHGEPPAPPPARSGHFVDAST